ncbi:VOC family protein [Bacillus licheniformis]
MKKKTSGIHHITAIVGHPQENVDFYAGVLGLRLVKKPLILMIREHTTCISAMKAENRERLLHSFHG